MPPRRRQEKRKSRDDDDDSVNEEVKQSDTTTATNQTRKDDRMDTSETETEDEMNDVGAAATTITSTSSSTTAAAARPTKPKRKKPRKNVLTLEKPKRRSATIQGLKAAAPPQMPTQIDLTPHERIKLAEFYSQSTDKVMSKLRPLDPNKMEKFNSIPFDEKLPPAKSKKIIKSFNEVLRTYGCEILPDHGYCIRRDGNCFPDTIGYILNVLSGKMLDLEWVELRDAISSSIRMRLVGWLRKNEHFQTSLGELSLLNHDPTWEEMCARLEQPNIWMETPAIQAAATVFELDIFLFVSDIMDEPIPYYANGFDRSPASTICHIANWNKEHFAPILIRGFTEPSPGQTSPASNTIDEPMEAQIKEEPINITPSSKSISSTRAGTISFVSEQLDRLSSRVEFLTKKLLVLKPPLNLGLDGYDQEFKQLKAQLHRTMTVGILGRNGLGKSYLLNLLLFITMKEYESFPPTKEAMEGWNYLMERNNTGLGRKFYYQQLEPFRQYLQDNKERLESNHVSIHMMTQDESEPYSHPAHMAQEKRVYEEVLKDYHRNGMNQDISIRAYLLPSQDDTGGTTTKCLINVVYGKTFQVIVKYLDRTSAQELAGKFLQYLIELENEELSPEYLTEIETGWKLALLRFEQLTGIDPLRIKLNSNSRFGQIRALWNKFQKHQQSNPDVEQDYPLPDRVKNIHVGLSPDIEEVLNHTHYYIGLGENMQVDRAYTRDLLDSLLSGVTRTLVDDSWTSENDPVGLCQSYAIASVTVFVPSTVLEGGLNLLDMPGTNEDNARSKQLTADGVNKSDILLVSGELLTGRELNADSSSKEVLSNDGQFLQKLLNGSSSQIIHLHCHENEACKTRTPKAFLKALKEQEVIPDDESMMRNSKAHLNALIEEQFGRKYRNSNAFQSHLPELRTAQENCSQLAIYPSLFASTLLNTPKELTAASGGIEITTELRERILLSSGVYQLLGHLRKHHIRSAINILQRLIKVDSPVGPITGSLDPDYDSEEEQKGIDLDGDAHMSSGEVDGESAEPASFLLQHGPIARLINELESKLESFDSHGISNVNQVIQVRQVANSILGHVDVHSKKSRAVAVLKFMKDSSFTERIDRISGDIRRQLHLAVSEWFDNLWSNTEDEAIDTTEHEIREKGKTLKNENRRSVFAPDKRGLAPQFKIRLAMFHHPINLPDLKPELFPLVQAIFDEYHKQVSTLVRDWLRTEFNNRSKGVRFESNLYFQQLAEDIFGSDPDSTLSVHFLHATETFFDHPNSKITIEANSIRRAFYNEQIAQMKKYLVHRFDPLVKMPRAAIIEELVKSAGNILHGTFKANHNETQKRIERLLASFRDQLYWDRKTNLIYTCLDKFLIEAATVLVQVDKQTQSEAKIIISDFKASFQTRMKEAEEQIHHLKGLLAHNDVNEGEALITVKLSQKNIVEPKHQHREATHHLIHKLHRFHRNMPLITLQRVRQLLGVNKPTQVTSLAVLTSQPDSGGKSEQDPQERLRLLKPMPSDVKRGLADLDKDLTPWNLETNPMMDGLGPNHLLGAIIDQLQYLNATILSDDSDDRMSVDELSHELKEFLKWSVQQFYGGHHDFKKLFSKIHLRSLEEYIGSMASASSSSTPIESNVWLGLVELGLLAHYLDYEIWVWPVGYKFREVTQPISIFNTDQGHTRKCATIHLGFVYQEKDPTRPHCIFTSIRPREMLTPPLTTTKSKKSKSKRK